MSDSWLILLMGLAAVGAGALVVNGGNETPGLIVVAIGGLATFIGATAIAVRLGIRDAKR